VPLTPRRVIGILLDFTRDGGPDSARDRLIVLDIRLPRVILSACIGAALAASGAIMQGLFRNPLADPALIGVSGGAGLAAAATIVLGDRFAAALGGGSSFLLLPFGAFLGGLLCTLMLHVIATRNGRTSIATMLLAGIALNALAGAATGVLVYLSDDRQLRDLTFWTLGSLSGATWAKAGVAGAVLVMVLAAFPYLARGLNALVLGEAEAFYLGIRVQRVKVVAIVVVALASGSSVAASGVIGFIGIVVPHLLRLLVGSDHRILLPLCLVLGAGLLMGADLFARTIVAPAELPVGVVTAIMGAPFFLWLILHRGRSLEA
jgi:iron complex transport system permease protein